MAKDEDLGFEIEDADEFDPFAEGDFIEEDEDGIEEMPSMTELPEEIAKKGAYDASRFDCAEDALESLLKNNPGRKPIFLKILEFCCEAQPASAVEDLVNREQSSNYSVYSPMTLCRMLERSGGMVSQVPESSETVVEDNGVEYLEIKDDGEVMWTATDAGLNVVAAHAEGGALRELMAHEAQYEPVYRKLFALLATGPCTKKQIDDEIDSDPLIQKPRRYSNHFIELLESREAMAWVDGKWTLTDLGQRYWDEISG